MAKQVEVKKEALKIEQLINMCISDLTLSKDKELYRVAALDDGLRLPVKVVGKNLEILNENDAMIFLKNRCHELEKIAQERFKGTHLVYLTAKTAKTILDSTLLNSRLQIKEKIKTFAFLSDDSYTFCRIPFDLTPEPQSTPNWDKFLENFSNNKAMQMWIGSLFVLDSDRSQYLWLYGRGANGKSTFAKVISNVLGNFARYEQVPGKSEERYWSYGLLGKRLIVIDDCNQYGFVKTGLFKTATGSGKCRVEAKFCPSRDAELTCKFLFTSNEKPMVSDELADQRRLIFCSALNADKFEWDPEFVARLEAELPSFVSNCVQAFKTACPDGREIPTDQTEAIELGGVFNEEIETWVEQHFDYDDHSYVEVSKFRAELAKTKLSDRRVYDFLEKKAVTRKSQRHGDKVIKVLKGIKQKLFTLESSL